MLFEMGGRTKHRKRQAVTRFGRAEERGGRTGLDVGILKKGGKRTRVARKVPRNVHTDEAAIGRAGGESSAGS